MKTSLTLLLFAFSAANLAAAPTSVLFATQFSADGSVRDVGFSLVSKDPEGFASARPLHASDLPELQRARFSALQAALSASAAAGGWRLTAGELAQTGSTSDFQEVSAEGAALSAPLVRVPIAGTERPVLTLWMTQTREGKTRYQFTSSEQWPAEVRSAILALWAWLQSQP